MPRGISREFLDLLARQRRVSKRRLKVVPVLVILGYVVAELADVAPAGPHVRAYVVGLAVAATGLFLASRRIYEGYEDSLRAAWDRWMAAAAGSDDIPEAYDRVTGEPGLWDWVPMGAALVVFANVASLLLLWFAAPNAGAFAMGTVLVDAAAVGGLGAWHLQSLRWSRRFDQAVHELYRDGEVGVFGRAGG